MLLWESTRFYSSGHAAHQRCVCFVFDIVPRGCTLFCLHTDYDFYVIVHGKCQLVGLVKWSALHDMRILPTPIVCVLFAEARPYNQVPQLYSDIKWEMHAIRQVLW